MIPFEKSMRYDAISEDSVRTMVDIFYAYVREDALLAPIFEAAIGTTAEAWAPHLEVLYNFWASVMLNTSRYQGSPLQKHKALPTFPPSLFSRWLALFAKAAIETHSPTAATVFIRKAVNIADNMKRGLYGASAASDAPPMPCLPETARAYRKTTPFSAENTPAALLQAHRTGADIWGKIVLTSGSLLYTIDGRTAYILTPETGGVIEPGVLHFVTPLDDAVFYVEFYREEEPSSSPARVPEG